MPILGNLITFLKRSMGRSVIRIESEPGSTGGVKNAFAQPPRPGCRITRQVQMAVQVGIFHIGTRHVSMPIKSYRL